MTTYEIIIAIFAFITLAVTVFTKISAIRIHYDGKIESVEQAHQYSLKKIAVMEIQIDNIRTETERKADRELVEEKFTNIKKDLEEIKGLIRNKDEK